MWEDITSLHSPRWNTMVSTLLKRYHIFIRISSLWRKLQAMIKAVFLLGTLKKNEPSNTEMLSAFLLERLRAKGFECETI